ncbi:MAG: hypothetical protein KHZ29_07945 [Desulfovibrionaceae bacterium]|nr:hypothetical protein [Desulfovibrionaceae bacterium]
MTFPSKTAFHDEGWLESMDITLPQTRALVQTWAASGERRFQLPPQCLRRME